MNAAMSAAALAAVKAGGKAMLDMPGKRRGEWRGKFLCKKIGDNRWWIDQDWGDPCRLYIESPDLEYAFGGGFESDLGSIPKIFQGITQLRLKPDSFPRPFSMHDWTYKTEKIFVRIPPEGAWHELPQTRPEADTTLLFGLWADGAKLAEAEVIYDGVRVGGGIAWRQHRREGTV